MPLLPLPRHLDVRGALAALDPEHEIEGLHPLHATGLLSVSPTPPRRRPVAARAVLAALAEYGVDLDGAVVTVLTDQELMETNPVANLVARVAAPGMLPLTAAVNLVSYDHPRAQVLAALADVLVVSIQVPRLVTADWVRPGAVVVDFNPVVIGMREVPGNPPQIQPMIVGGVDLASVRGRARLVAPIPGGVGPVMLGLLAAEIVDAAVAAGAGEPDAR
jgi:methylenetetrahydrofolate dehydrogenase (NADP+)/methenyltetrahydrofolate cyclohydrolase